MTDHLEEVFRKHATFEGYLGWWMDEKQFRLAVEEILAEERKKNDPISHHFNFAGTEVRCVYCGCAPNSLDAVRSCEIKSQPTGRGSK